MADSRWQIADCTCLPQAGIEKSKIRLFGFFGHWSLEFVIWILHDKPILFL
jgi:hypothetical protein